MELASSVDELAEEDMSLCWAAIASSLLLIGLALFDEFNRESLLCCALVI